MNKLEFQQKLEEGSVLIEKKNYSGAVDLFDELNLDSVKDARFLQNIAKAYEKCRRYQDAAELLLQAHECAPRSRGTLFHLCTVSIKGGDLAGAMKYYNDFCQIAKYDAERYILQYRIAQAEGRDDEELIRILENFKGEEPDDRWMYELAKLYTTNERINDALEVCDEITLWFYNGKYVQLAKELRAYLTGEALDPSENVDDFANNYGSYGSGPEENMSGEFEGNEPAEIVEETAPELTEEELQEELVGWREAEPEDVDEEDAVDEAKILAYDSRNAAPVEEPEEAEEAEEPEDVEDADIAEDADAEILETNEEALETGELAFVPDKDVFSEDKESDAPEFSQHSIFSSETGLEIVEIDEEEKLPEGEESLQEAIKEPVPVWEIPGTVTETVTENGEVEETKELITDADEAMKSGINDAVSEMQSLDFSEETKAEASAEAEEEPSEENSEEISEEASAEETEAEPETVNDAPLDIVESDDKGRVTSVTLAEEALKARTAESVATDQWAHVTFGDEAEDEHVVFTVTGASLKKEPETLAGVAFDDSIFGHATEEKTESKTDEPIIEIPEVEVTTAETHMEVPEAADPGMLSMAATMAKATAGATVKEATETVAETAETVVVAAKAEEKAAEAETQAPEVPVVKPETVATPAKTEENPVKPETTAPPANTEETPAKTEVTPAKPEEDEWKRPSEELDELEDLEAQLEKKQVSSEKLGNLPIEPETGKDTWHFIVFGENDVETLERAQEILKEFTETIPNCPKRMLKTSAKRIENANIVDSLDHFLGSMVIIQNAAMLSDAQLKDFSKVLEKDDNSLLIVFTDTEEHFEKMFSRVPELSDSFTAAFEGHRVTARDLVNTAKEFLYYKDALMTRDAEGVCYEYARELLAERKGFYRSEIREYARKALHYAEHNGLFGMFSSAVDDDGFLHVTDKFFKKAGAKK